MIYTLNYLNEHRNKPLNFTLDFSKEVEGLIMVEHIGECSVTGTYSFANSRYLEFDLDVKAEVIVLASDTLNPIKLNIEFNLIDDVSETTKTEYQINNEAIDFYELVWGWFITEIPYRIFEED